MPALLLILLALPLLAALVVASLGRGRAEAARVITLIVVLVNLGVTVAAAGWAYPRLLQRADDDPAGQTFRPVLVPGATEKNAPTTKWDIVSLGLPTRSGQSGPAVQFYIGIDGLNIWLIVLTSLLMVAAVLTSWDAITDRANEYYAWLLVLATGILGVFLSFDMILFYVFFELTLVPLFFLVGIWGGPSRREGAVKLFLYTLVGSLVTLVGMLIAATASSSDGKPATFAIPELVTRFQERYRQTGDDLKRSREDLSAAQNALRAAGDQEVAQSRVKEMQARLAESASRSNNLLGFQLLLFVTLSVGFLVKVPMVPFHTWQPLAYAEAPMPVTFLLSAILAKMGTYGLLRICIPLAPDAAFQYGLPILGTLAVIGIIYGALCAYGQVDLKRLLAYSSLSHLGFCVLGLLAMNAAGLAGGLLHMVNHALATGALFLLVGMLADRYSGNRRTDVFSGLAAKYHIMALLVMLMALSSVGLPGLNNFVSEMLMLAGVVSIDATPASGRGWLLAIGAAVGIVLGAWYTMTLLRNVFFGPLMEPSTTEGTSPASDLTPRELTAVLPLVVLCVVLGVFPQPVLDASRHDVNVVAALSNDARERAGWKPRPIDRSSPMAGLPTMPHLQDQ